MRTRRSSVWQPAASYELGPGALGTTRFPMLARDVPRDIPVLLALDLRTGESTTADFPDAPPESLVQLVRSVDPRTVGALVQTSRGRALAVWRPGESEPRLADPSVHAFQAW